MLYFVAEIGKILPFSFCLVDSENDASWKWFLKRIRETYGTREGMSIVSDRHESILNVTSIVYPVVPHCVCLYHLWGNVKKYFRKHHKLLRILFFFLQWLTHTQQKNLINTWLRFIRLTREWKSTYLIWAITDGRLHTPRQ